MHLPKAPLSTSVFATLYCLSLAFVITTQAVPHPLHHSSLASPSPSPRLASRGIDLLSIYDLTSPFYSSVGVLLEDASRSPCDRCIDALKSAKALTVSQPELLPAVLIDLCKTTAFRRPDVCDGLLSRLGPQLGTLLLDMDLDSSDSSYACAYLFPGTCPIPTDHPAPIQFPKPRPDNAAQPLPSGETIQVLHFSDWHVDPLYRPGTEAQCTHSICCRDYGKLNDPGPIRKPASKWGEGKCDTPLALGISALNAINQFVTNPSFGIFTGDIVSHDYWKITQKYVADEEARSYELFKRYLGNMKLFVAMGNHDSYPADQAPMRVKTGQYASHSWLYNHVSSLWEKNGWITADEAAYAREHNAMMVTRPLPGLKLISINSDLYFARNYFTMVNTAQDDPSGLFADLIQELQDSEDRQERVWIIGHMAPIKFALPRASISFHRIVARYSPHVIAGLFFGHFHQDKFYIVHDPEVDIKDEFSAVNVVYQGPSVSTLDRSNPAIRWYDIDAKTFSVLDTHTAIADLSEAPVWEAQDLDPEWKHEYSARETYKDLERPLTLNEPLSPQFWYRTVQRMKADRNLFEEYLKFESKSSVLRKKCKKGTKCESSTLCELEAASVVEYAMCEGEYSKDK